MSIQNIAVSTELMKNYKQTVLMSPENKFEALQTDTGTSLLFSIGTDQVFYVTQESVGHETGWVKTDLSTAQIAKSFPGQNGLSCKTFEAAQSAADGTIGIAMVVTDSSGNDHLFLCLGNSYSDTSWTQQPGWVQYPFDNPAQNVTIACVFMSETASNTQYVVVDILRDPASAEKLISRYYIDTTGNAPAWQPHDVSIDLEADSYQSCLGRQYLQNSPHQPTIDGLYTSGQVDGSAQLIFQPLYNVFNPAIPAPSARLQIPGGVVANAIASSRKSDLSTDLYVCGADGGLYYFAANNQQDGATAVLLAQNALFNGVSKMYAHQTGNTVIVWGLNGSDEIFYTSCTAGQETASPSAWSYPLPIVTGVDLFSPYINRVDDGNTFFAVGGNTLLKLIKSPYSLIWNSQSVTLPSPNSADTQQYSSYTTRILVTDENSQPVINTPVSISAVTRTAVYINHLYYVLDSTGIQINTDSLGSVTIVEWVNGLTGTRLNVAAGGGTVHKINPMDKPFQKVAQLNTVASLQSATIVNDDGSTTPLVGSGVSQNDLQAAADSNGKLGTAYNTLSNKSGNATAQARMAVIAVGTPAALSVSSADAISVDIGDLFRWLESGVEAVIQFVEDAVEEVWYFVVTIAGQVYTAALDTVEAVVAAAEWVFKQIKTLIEDLIKFLQFLFGWQDILTTHNVMKNVFTRLVQECANNLSSYKTNIANAFQAIQSDINKWADIPSFDQTPASTTGSNQPPEGQNSAPSNLGLHHYQGNAQNANSTFSPATFGQEIFDDLLNLLNSEEATLTAAYDAIKTDIIDQFNTLSVTQIIQKFVAIIADTLLQTAENIILAALDVFSQLIEGLLSALTATIDIPVLSWLYKELTGNDLSFLDVVCLVAAIPATIVYRIAASTAPFPQGDPFTQGLLQAQNFDEVRGQFFTSTQSAVAGSSMMVAVAAPQQVLSDTRLQVFGFVSGMFAFAGSVVLVATTGISRALDQLNVGRSLQWRLATVSAFANVAYVAPNISSWINIQTANWYQQLNNSLTAVSIIKGFVNIGLTSLNSASGAAKISPAIESIINVVWNVPVITNIIVNKDRWNTDYKALIPESIGNFAFNLGGILEFPIAMTQDLKAKVIESGVQFGLMLVYGICMPIAGGIFAFAPGQD